MKRKRKGAKPDGADLLAAPGMEELAAFTREILKVPKLDVDERAVQKTARSSDQKTQP
jgi:hypothetical protein